MPPKTLPEKAQEIYNSAEASAKKTCPEGDEQCVARKAWAAVKRAYKQDADGNWVPKSEVTEFSLYIDKAGFHKETGEMRFHAVGSDTLDDTYGDNMTAELFSDFLQRIESKEPPPDGYGNEFWNGGIPYLSISHYPDLEGKAVPGEMTSVYMDGNRLKGQGKFFETPIGLATFKSVCKDQTEANPDEKIRISIAFLDYKHRHKSNGYTFERKSITDKCPECFKEFLQQSSQGKEFLRGHLIHWAFTRVPVNQRTPVELEEKSMSEIVTQKDDAASIVGDELAEEIESIKAETRSEAVVIKSDMEKDEEDEMSDDEKKKKKMEEENKSEVAPDKLDQILSLLSKPQDAIDEAYSEFRAEMAKAETLEHLQPAFENFANTIRGQYDVAPQEEKAITDTRMDVVMEKLSLLAEKVDLLTKARPEKPVEVLPERRSITLDPNAVLQQPRKPLSIEEIAKRSVGL